MKNSYESYVNSFLEYLLYELNYSNKTTLTYKNALKEYGEFLNLKKLNFLNITSDNANSYKAHLIASNYENKTSSLHLSTVRSFYNYLIEINVLKNNVFSNIKNPKVEKKLPNFLNNSETDRMFNDIKWDNDLDVRNNLIIEFLYATGLRVSELCNIKLKDLNSSNKSIKVLGKGSKERIVFYKACNEYLFDYYLNTSRINILNGISSEYLFTSKSGKSLTTRTVEEIVKKYSIKNNIKSKVTPHTLRHTYATDLLNNDADIRSVGELLGHESLSTTQIYTHVTSDRLKEVYKKTHPRGKMQK
ncbi:MAG: tyrosine recombinase [Firmicutes bacterium]|nr:tyrosine recombinase [Bacillota bacterium]